MNAKKISAALVVALVVVGVFGSTIAAQEACDRSVPVKFKPVVLETPYYKTKYWANIVEAAFGSVFMSGSLSYPDGDVSGSLRDPPLRVWVGSEGSGDYVFEGEMSVSNLPTGPPQDLVTLKVRLRDVHHGNVIGKEQQISWAEADIRDRPKQKGFKEVHELARRYMVPKPLDDMLHEYEGMPQTAQINPDEYVIGSGQKMAINLNGILDSDGKPAKPWQRVMVEVEKGELTNRVPKVNNYYIFDVGEGTIRLQYKAPDQCKEYQAEIIRVHNTCEIDPNQTPMAPKDEIAETPFVVRCIRGTFEFTWEGTTKGQAGGTDVTITYSESGEVPFDVEWKDGEGTFKAKDDVHGTSIITAYPPSGQVFKHSETHTAKHVLDGEVLDPESDNPRLRMKCIRHIHGEEILHSMTELPLRDGAKKEFPYKRSGKGFTHDTTYTITLHLDTED